MSTAEQTSHAGANVLCVLFSQHQSSPFSVSPQPIAGCSANQEAMRPCGSFQPLRAASPRSKTPPALRPRRDQRDLLNRTTPDRHHHRHRHRHRYCPDPIDLVLLPPSPTQSLRIPQKRPACSRQNAAAVPSIRTATCAPEARRTACPTTPRRHRYVNDFVTSSDGHLERPRRPSPRRAPLFLAPGPSRSSIR